MPILNFNIAPIGQSGVIPQLIFIQTNDSVATVTAAGYLNKFVAEGNAITTTDMAMVTTSATPNGQQSAALYTISYSGGNWTLMPYGTITPPIGSNWVNVTGTSQAMVAGTSYVAANASTIVSFTLPVTAAFGAVFQVQGFGAAGWIINQNAGQQILGSSMTTVGTAGSLRFVNPSAPFTNDQNAGATLLCVVPNTTFVVYAFTQLPYFS